MREGAYCTTNLPDGDGLMRTGEAVAITPRFVVPKRERQTEGSRLGMNAMRAANLRRALELKSAAFQHVEERVDLLRQNVSRIAQQQRIGRVNNV